jgi:GNAT superfamily N-acetyltransferase
VHHAAPGRLLPTRHRWLTVADVSLEPVALLHTYDTQLRAWMPRRLPAGAVLERDGPLLRLTEPGQRGFVTYVDLDGVDGDELDALIARQRDFYDARGEAVEWKLHGHDRPADLPDRLIAAGFVPDEPETVVIGAIGPLLAGRAPVPDGIRLREVTAEEDLWRIAAMEEAVWGEDQSYLAVGLRAELEADPDSVTIVVAEAGDEMVSAGWVRYIHETEFATLWGGSTLAPWRQRGVYRALLAHRADLARQRGHSLLEVDASPDSRPILERSGFVAVTTTTPYVHRPSP